MNVQFIALTAVALISSAVATCNHPYVPATPNTRWTYSSSMAGGGYTMRVVSNDGGSFVLENAFKSMKIQSKVRCASDGSLIQELYPSIDDLNTKTETLSYSGVAFPSVDRWVIGGKWTQSFKIKITIGPGNPGQVQFWTTTVNSKILSSDNVIVPAGKFTALKIERTIDLELVTPMQGDTTPLRSTETTTIWYARGIGVVKSSTGKTTTLLTSFVKV